MDVGLGRIGTSLGLLLSFGCGPTVPSIPGTQVRMDLQARTGLFDAPFPSDHLRQDDQVVLPPLPDMQAEGLDSLLSAFTDIDLPGVSNPWVEQLDQALTETSGFALTGGVFFAFDGPVASWDRARDAVGLVDVTPGSPTFLQAAAIDVHVRRLPSRYAPGNLMVLLPVQGAPLRPGTTYAAFVTRSHGDGGSSLLGVPSALRAVVEGVRTADWDAQAFERYRAAVDALEEVLDPDDLAALAVFTTQDPTAELHRALAWAGAEVPARWTLDWTLIETHPEFCVFQGGIEMPILQEGLPPYFAPGSGGWVYDDGGRPVLQGRAPSRVFLTVPRTAAERLPLAVFIRTGGGGDRPLIDRGVRAEPGGPAIEPATGIALDLAREGWAGITWDGPLGGLRNPAGLDEQFLVMNFTNLRALRDNVRQSALEGALLAQALEDLEVDVDGCPGASADGFDLERLTLIGHSMGATIAPLVAAIEPRYQALILSGAGASWLMNLIHKERPLPVRRVASATLGYLLESRLTESDPALSLVQWAGESADPQVYARQVRAQVLMVQGIRDRYIPPPIANALSFALELDLVGPALEPSFEAEGARFGLTRRSPPMSGNRSGRTAALVQYAEDGVEGGHEVFFQRSEPKEGMRRFLRTLPQPVVR